MEKTLRDRRRVRDVAVASPDEGLDDARDFWDHLEELRRRILASLAFFLVLACVAFAFARHIVDFFTAPAGDLGIDFVAIRPQDKFVVYMESAAAAAFLAALPFALAQAAAFIAPALERRRRRALGLAVVGSTLLSFAGFAFARWALSPFVASFFASFAKDDGVAALWSLADWTSLFMGSAFACALVFQAPWLMIALVGVGLLRPAALSKYRRHVIVGIFVVAAIVTPPDALSQIVVGLPLWLLFELTILVCRLIRPEEKRWTDANS